MQLPGRRAPATTNKAAEAPGQRTAPRRVQRRVRRRGAHYENGCEPAALSVPTDHEPL